MALADTPGTDFAAAALAFPEQRVETRAGTIGYRSTVSPSAPVARDDTPLVLLHGIGSGAASWVAQLATLGAHHRVFAWDAPGYGASTPPAAAQPSAADYAQALLAWLDALAIERIVLVGHSLGATMAGAFAARHPARVRGLLLLSPALGYGRASSAVRADKLNSRLAPLHKLGPAGLAEQRSANLCGPHASDAAREWVRANMARIVPGGYEQAAHMLVNADLAADLTHYHGALRIAVGSADTITPPASCDALAAGANVIAQHLPDLGHACYIEAPAVLDALILESARLFLSTGHHP